MRSPSPGRSRASIRSPSLRSTTLTARQQQPTVLSHGSPKMCWAVCRMPKIWSPGRTLPGTQRCRPAHPMSSRCASATAPPPTSTGATGSCWLNRCVRSTTVPALPACRPPATCSGRWTVPPQSTWQPMCRWGHRLIRRLPTHAPSAISQAAQLGHAATHPI